MPSVFTLNKRLLGSRHKEDIGAYMAISGSRVYTHMLAVGLVGLNVTLRLSKPIT